MGIETNIEWCDSTANAQMGCDGCELWSRKTGEGTCYAATLTERYGGRNGWPKSFGEPAIFPHRIAQACRWPDLAGTNRPGKPWLNGYPRMVFLDDMGDTFTESLPPDWLAPYIPAMAAAPCIWMMLTKRGRRMRRFWARHGPPPRNFWLMVSVTQESSLGRVAELLKIPDAVRLVSYEPMWEWVEIPLDGIHGVIFGGESGPGAKPADLGWFRRGIEACRAAGVAPFVKQLGPAPYEIPLGSGRRYNTESEMEEAAEELGSILAGTRQHQLLNRKGGDWDEWPEGLRIRELPAPPAPGRGGLFP